MVPDVVHPGKPGVHSNMQSPRFTRGEAACTWFHCTALGWFALARIIPVALGLARLEESGGAGHLVWLATGTLRNGKTSCEHYRRQGLARRLIAIMCDCNENDVCFNDTCGTALLPVA